MKRILSRSGVLLGFICLLLSHRMLGEGTLAVIVNPANKLDGVTTKELQRYFKAEKTKTPEGLRLVIVMQDVGRPERNAALKNIYKMNEAQYTNFFVEATFTGSVTAAPKSVASGAAVKRFIAATPGGIGYVLSSDIDKSVKSLKVDDKNPEDSDYPLKAE